MNFSIDIILLVAVSIAVLACIVLGVRLWKLEKRLRILFGGKDAKGLEDVIMLLHTEAMEARRALQNLDKRATEVREQLKRSVQGVGMVRFNPFRDAGGDQSFSIALLDETRNGVVISSLYARDGVRIYGKPISAGTSTYTLSAEEEQAIKKALRES